MININNINKGKNFKNIHLFASGDYNENIYNIIKKYNFTDNDCIVLFNKPSIKLKDILKDIPIDYNVLRGYEHHIVNDSIEILNHKFNIDNCFFISDYKDLRLDNCSRKIKNIAK